MLPSGLVYSRLFVALAFTLALGLADPVGAGIRVRALLPEKPALRVLAIGLNEYKFLPSLQFPIGDATLIAEALSSIPNRAEIRANTVLSNPSRQEILTEVVQIAQSLGPDETAVIFYAGHSEFSEVDGHPILFPVDARPRMSGAYGSAGAAYGSADASVPDGATRQVSAADIENELFFADLISAFAPEDRVIFIGDGCHFDTTGLGTLAELLPNLAILSSSKADEIATDGVNEIGHSPFAYHLSRAITSPVPDHDKDDRLSLEEIFVHIYPSVASPEVTGFSQHPSIFGRYVHRAFLALAQKPYEVIALDSDVVALLGNLSLSEINGAQVQSVSFNSDGRALRLGEQEMGFLNSGLNVFRGLKQEVRVWFEDGRLTRYEAPYRRSHAILFAIDDYERVTDPRGRPATGLQQLEGMVDRAKELGRLFEGFGFERVTVFPDAEASSAAIEAELKKYWDGGVFEEVDRLIFYFGGHGVEYSQQTVLATYDYDRKRKALTTFRANNLVQSHAEFLAPKHVLILLDVCHAGLAIYKTLTDDSVDAEESELIRLSRIRDDTQSRSRNIFVAGTGAEEALWENGGIFTQYLIRALQGAADNNSDGIIQFSEYTEWVRHHVSFKASRSGHQQKPSFMVMEHHGDGRVLFELD